MFHILAAVKLVPDKFLLLLRILIPARDSRLEIIPWNTDDDMEFYLDSW